MRMSKIISGYVVSKNEINGMWRGWHVAHEKPTVVADTYRGLLALIRNA
jgi:hypothetical protein